MSRPRINLIGAGKLGRTLARLWRDQLEIGAVATQSLESAVEAVAFIDAGQPATLTAAAPTAATLTATTLTAAAALPAADYWLLATPDDALGTLANMLAESRDDWRDTLVFHCSGATSSESLAPLADAGAFTASAHPVHSFADPSRSLTTFQNTRVVMEGNSAATDALATLFTAVGARPFVAARCDKALYHASTAMASNLLVALLYQAENALCDATGLSPAKAREVLAPLSLNTVENYFRGGAEAALTGPVTRGDAQTVTRHLDALAGHESNQSGDRLSLYRNLSSVAVDIALQQAHTAADTLQRIRELLHEQR